MTKINKCTTATTTITISNENHHYIDNTNDHYKK